MQTPINLQLASRGKAEEHLRRHVVGLAALPSVAFWRPGRVTDLLQVVAIVASQGVLALDMSLTNKKMRIAMSDSEGMAIILRRRDRHHPPSMLFEVLPLA